MITPLLFRSARSGASVSFRAAAAAAALFLTLAIPSGGLRAGQSNPGPVIRSCDVAPRFLPIFGGTVQLSAEVFSPVGVNAVVARITDPAGQTIDAPLAGGVDNRYTGSLLVPANTTGAVQRYGVVFAAVDGEGRLSVRDCGIFRVQGPDTEPPVIFRCGATPRFLPREGGSVTILAELRDREGIDEVTAFVQAPGGEILELPLERRSGPDPVGIEVWGVELDAPANPGRFPRRFRVGVQAFDRSGNEAREDCGSVYQAGEVIAGTQGRLAARPRAVHLGLVQVDTRRAGLITLRNVGPPGSELLGVVELPGPPYRLGVLEAADGTVEGGHRLRRPLEFRLRAGQQIRLAVIFRPPAPGLFRERVIVSTSEQGFPVRSIPCVGVGCRVRRERP